MKRVRAVVFDCDGVMFDSMKANEAYYNHVLEHFGKPEMSEEQCDYVHMNTAEQSVTYLFRNDPKLEDALAYWRSMNYHPFIPMMEMEPYLQEFLEYLRPTYKTAIATNRSDTMPAVLNDHGLDGRFDLVVTCLDVEHPKPHPESLIKILDYFDLSPEEAIYIGDSRIDEMTASAAGVPLVGYKNPRLSAVLHVTHFKEIEEFLERRK
jgi:phosphoglycolate phosphatase-like HAD superfamily hydrolase